MQMRVYIDIIFFPVSSPIHAVSRLNISYSQILFVLDSNRSSSPAISIVFPIFAAILAFLRDKAKRASAERLSLA